jgi:hypothetical protein
MTRRIGRARGDRSRPMSLADSAGPGTEAGDPLAMVGPAWALLHQKNVAEAKLWYARLQTRATSWG